MLWKNMYPSTHQRKPGCWEKENVKKLLDKFTISRENIETIINKMDFAMTAGLYGGDALKMINTFVTALPDGTEEGDFFALDLGGTNFRVLFVQLKNQDVKMSHQVYTIAEEMRNGGTADQLFGYIAECLAKFVKEKLGAGTRKINTVGFTFSFPVDQKGLCSGELITWTKGFEVSDAVGQDVVELLMKAIKKQNEIEVEQIALLNDTTGVLLSCAYKDPNVMIGIILGTGTNACYMGALDVERNLSSVSRHFVIKKDSKHALINTEWGAFGDRFNELEEIDTCFDQIIDRESLNAGQQKFEKMISGMYLGEIVRQCVLSLINEFVLFSGHVSEELQTKNSFTTIHVSEFCSGDAKKCVDILHELGYGCVTLEECLVIQDICVAVSLRAARLSAAGLTCILRRLQKKTMSVAMDGSLYKKHPTFKRFMHQALEEFAPNTVVTIRMADDGSGIGAAVAAAVAERLSRQTALVD